MRPRGAYITGWGRLAILLSVAIVVVLVQRWGVTKPPPELTISSGSITMPEPEKDADGLIVVEIDPEDAADLIIEDIEWSDNVLVVLPGPVDGQLTFTFPANAQGYYGDVMEVEGTGDLEIECGTLKFKDGKLVGIVGCGEVVMFTTTDVWQ